MDEPMILCQEAMSDGVWRDLTVPTTPAQRPLTVQAWGDRLASAKLVGRFRAYTSKGVITLTVIREDNYHWVADVKF